MTPPPPPPPLSFVSLQSKKSKSTKKTGEESQEVEMEKRKAKKSAKKSAKKETATVEDPFADPSDPEILSGGEQVAGQLFRLNSFVASLFVLGWRLGPISQISLPVLQATRARRRRRPRES